MALSDGNKGWKWLAPHKAWHVFMVAEGITKGVSDDNQEILDPRRTLTIEYYVPSHKLTQFNMAIIFLAITTRSMRVVTEIIFLP